MDMEALSAQELAIMKYSELQRLAKSAGLKANQKADKLLKSLKQHFLHEPNGENAGQDSESSQSSFTLTDEDDISSKQEKSVPVSHVTKRRGRGQMADKITSIPKVELNTGTEVTNEEKQEATCEDKSPSQEKPSGKRNRKRSIPADEETAAEGQTKDPAIEAMPPGGKIPRYACSQLKSENTATKPTTPNFKKLHEAHFKKMESIDTFVERNKKRLEVLSNPNRVAKATHHAKKENVEPEIKHLGITGKTKYTGDFTAEQTSLEIPVIKPMKKKQAEGNSLEAVSPSRQTPCNARRQSKPGDKRLKATTPNLKKLKESHVEKMSLLNEYIDRKQERLNAITNSIQEVKMLAGKKILLKQVDKPISVGNPKKNLNSVSLFSPVPPRGRRSFACTPASQRRSPRASINLANLSLLTEKTAFKPSVLSSSKMNVRFSETTKDNEYKRSLTKTPARRSPYVQVDSDTPSNQQIQDKPIRKSLGKPINPESTIEKCITEEFTPFKFMGEKSETPSTNKKSTFDIKASLARPLGYEPHKGKLKPWLNGNENPGNLSKSVNRSLSILKKEYKQPHLQTRETRRDEHVKGRKNKKDEMIGTRRGLILA